MKIDHVTYHIPDKALSNEVAAADLTQTMAMLGFHSVEVNEPPNSEPVQDARLRWYEDDDGFQIHLISTPQRIGPIPLCLGHFAIDVDGETIKRASKHHWCTRDSRDTSGRVWLEHPNGLRIEVRCPIMQRIGPIPERRSLRRPLWEGVNVTYHDMDEKASSIIESQDASDLLSPEGRSFFEQNGILAKALLIYSEKNPTYNDNWRRFGWRGCAFRLRERAERVWDGVWDAKPSPNHEVDFEGVIDDLHDLINFAAFTIRAIRESNRDGSWFS